MSHDNPNPDDLTMRAEQTGARIDPRIRAAIIAEAERSTGEAVKSLVQDLAAVVQQHIDRAIAEHLQELHGVDR